MASRSWPLAPLLPGTGNCQLTTDISLPRTFRPRGQTEGRKKIASLSVPSRVHRVARTSVYLNDKNGVEARKARGPGLDEVRLIGEPQRKGIRCDRSVIERTKPQMDGDERGCRLRQRKPGGRKIIAQPFRAGEPGQRNKTSPARDESPPPACPLSFALRGFRVSGPLAPPRRQETARHKDAGSSSVIAKPLKSSASKVRRRVIP
jgi:hypothetical protein